VWITAISTLFVAAVVAYGVIHLVVALDALGDAFTAAPPTTPSATATS
jgi:hypothetical protein